MCIQLRVLFFKLQTLLEKVHPLVVEPVQLCHKLVPMCVFACHACQCSKKCASSAGAAEFWRWLRSAWIGAVAVGAGCSPGGS